MSSKRVVVTGLGVTSPVGGDVPSTWDALVNGRSGVRPLTQDWAETLPVRIAGTAAVEPTDVLERVKARRWDRSTQLAMIAATEAWSDAGLADTAEGVGVAFASGIGGVTTLLSNYDALLEKGPRRVSPLAVPMLMPNAPAASISLAFGARAFASTPVSACASGNEAIALIFSDGTALRMNHHQDCCEQVEIEDLNGDLADLLYTPLLVAEERTNESGSEETGCSQTWTFYTLRTVKGSIDIRWLGESNGYYSESVNLDIGEPETPLSHHAQMALIEDSRNYRSAYGSDGKTL